MQTTAGTVEHSFRKGYSLAMPTSRAILGCVSRIHLHQRPTGPFCLVRKLLEKSTPRCISDALSQTVIMYHVVDTKVLNGDGLIDINNSSAVLVREIPPPVGDALMNVSNHLAPLGPEPSTFLTFAQPSLASGKFFLAMSEEPGILDLPTIAESGEGFQPYVNADTVSQRGQGTYFNLASEGGEPFACGSAPHRTGLGGAFQETVNPGFDRTNPGKGNDIPLYLADSWYLRIGEAVIPPLTTEPGIARFLPCLDSPEESLECQVNTSRNVLEHLGVHHLERNSLFLEIREDLALGKIRKTFASLFPGFLSLFQQMVVQPAAFIKGLLKERCLSVRWIKSVLECSKHRAIITQPEGLGNSSAA